MNKIIEEIMKTAKQANKEYSARRAEGEQKITELKARLETLKESLRTADPNDFEAYKKLKHDLTDIEDEISFAEFQKEATKKPVSKESPKEWAVIDREVAKETARIEADIKKYLNLIMKDLNEGNALAEQANFAVNEVATMHNVDGSVLRPHIYPITSIVGKFNKLWVAITHILNK